MTAAGGLSKLPNFLHLADIEDSGHIYAELGLVFYMLDEEGLSLKLDGCVRVW